MDGRLILIEQKLLGIDPAGFQQLCDAYFFLREEALTGIHRPGSQRGKQKTTVGPVDTFMRMADGSLWFAEYTTQKDGITGKLISDINKCLDEAKTGVPAGEIDKIVLCFNVKLDQEEERTIISYAHDKNKRVELLGADWFALEIYCKYPLLGKDMLGLPVDTGQVLPLSQFIGEYNNKACHLATPLDNLFFDREKELKDIYQLFEQTDMVILTGAPGVGKTKIATEFTTSFIEKNPSCTAWAITNKDTEIYEDLRIQLTKGKDFIILVDDANRQLLQFRQLLGIFKEQRTGTIKLIITVRDYALNDIKTSIVDFDPVEYPIFKFSDEAIIHIISSDSFNIRNPDYQKKIVGLADGNPRLAVMASRLAMQKQQQFLYGDASELYDGYFKTFIADFDIFRSPVLLKTIGIISFFYSINRADKAFIEKLLGDFKLDYHQFHEAIEELQRRELVEVQYDHVRISEQVLGAYFFYKTFIRDSVLSFETLLFTYFFEWNKRFGDTIIPINNEFGFDNVGGRIKPVLQQFLSSIADNHKKVMTFLKTFWFYLPDETLVYCANSIASLDEPKEPQYKVSGGSSGNSEAWDETLDLLANFFKQYTDSFAPALQLCFEYTRKRPARLPKLVKLISTHLVFTPDDEKHEFYQQRALFKTLIKKAAEGLPVYQTVLLELVGAFLKYHYRSGQGGRKMTIHIITYPLPWDDSIREFRKKIWDYLFENFNAFPQNVTGIINDLGNDVHGVINPIAVADIALIIPFIEAELDPEKFEHRNLVHNLVEKIARWEVEGIDTQSLQERFADKEFDDFEMLSWDTVDGKTLADFEDHDAFDNKKIEELEENFLFSDTAEFPAFRRLITDYLASGENKQHSLRQSLNIIVVHNFRENPAIGFALLEYILEAVAINMQPLFKTFSVITEKSPDWADRLWQLLNNWKTDTSVLWRLAFFDVLPVTLANEDYKLLLLETFSSIDRPLPYLGFSGVDKFSAVDFDAVTTALNIVVNKIEQDKIRIVLQYDFFVRYISYAAQDFSLFAKAYLQQEQLGEHFDHQRKGLAALVQIREAFLFEYLETFYGSNARIRKGSNNHLAFIWDFDNYAMLVERTADYLIEQHPWSGYGSEKLNVIFEQLTDPRKTKAIDFLPGYITKHCKNTHAMNAIFKVIHKQLPDNFADLMTHYLSVNTAVTDFEKIRWIGDGGLYNGNTIIGEVRAAAWRNILQIIEGHENQLAILPVKIFVNKEIQIQLASAERERKSKFSEPGN